MDKRYAVGIDLGTTNSALAVSEAESAGRAGDRAGAAARFPAGERRGGDPPLGPLPAAGGGSGGGFRPSPWVSDPQGGIVGRFAREHGALLPDRLVTSAKSWLGHPHVDPRQPVLPWGSELGERKVSPFEASRRYLEHLREALLHHLRQRGEEAGLEACAAVLTVPASFDEVARGLTFEAAAAAGWGEVTLLEEQQAAFYHWLAQAGDGWRRAVRPGEVVLICDVGGGTADFSLVAVAEEAGNLVLERVSVGDHILLGGDNMDLALAYALNAELEGQGKKLDSRAVPSSSCMPADSARSASLPTRSWRRCPSPYPAAARACSPAPSPPCCAGSCCGRCCSMVFCRRSASTSARSAGKRPGCGSSACPTRPIPPSAATWPGS